MTDLQKQTLGPVVFVPFMGNYGGIERNLIALSSWFDKRGKAVTVLCFSCLFDIQSYWDHRLKLVCLTDSKNPWTRARLLSDFLQTNYRETGLIPLLFGTKAAFYMGIRCKGPFALHYTDPPSLLSGKRLPGLIGKLRYAGANFLTNRGVQSAHIFLTMTYRNADELEKIHYRRPVVVFQGGLPPTRTIFPHRRLPGEPLRFLSVCRLEESKRLDWIIRSVELFNERADTNVKAKVILVGDGSMRKNLEERAKLAPYIEVMGGLSMEDLETDFAKAALFAVPALQGYGLPVLEALYRNIPVVVHRDSGVTEALENEKLSMIADGDSEAFANSLVEALSKVSNNAFPPTPTTRIPTEDGWVEELGQICLWTPSVADRPAS